jgi:hypothetical protein
MSFFYLAQITKSGSFSVRSIDNLMDFVTRTNEARQEIRASTSMYKYIGLAAPFALALVVALMMGMFRVFEQPAMMGPAPIAPAGIAGLGLELFTGPPPDIHFFARGLILFSAIGLAFLTSYASHFTNKNLVWPGIACFLAALAIFMLPALTDLAASFLGV